MSVASSVLAQVTTAVGRANSPAQQRQHATCHSSSKVHTKAPNGKRRSPATCITTFSKTCRLVDLHAIHSTHALVRAAGRHAYAHGCRSSAGAGKDQDGDPDGGRPRTDDGHPGSHAAEQAPCQWHHGAAGQRYDPARRPAVGTCGVLLRDSRHHQRPVLPRPGSESRKYGDNCHRSGHIDSCSH